MEDVKIDLRDLDRVEVREGAQALYSAMAVAWARAGVTDKTLVYVRFRLIEAMLTNQGRLAALFLMRNSDLLPLLRNALGFREIPDWSRDLVKKALEEDDFWSMAVMCMLDAPFGDVFEGYEPVRVALQRSKPKATCALLLPEDCGHLLSLAESTPDEVENTGQALAFIAEWYRHEGNERVANSIRNSIAGASAEDVERQSLMVLLQLASQLH